MEEKVALRVDLRAAADEAWNRQQQRIDEYKAHCERLVAFVDEYRTHLHMVTFLSGDEEEKAGAMEASIDIEELLDCSLSTSLALHDAEVIEALAKDMESDYQELKGEQMQHQTEMAYGWGVCEGSMRRHAAKLRKQAEGGE